MSLASTAMYLLSIFLTLFAFAWQDSDSRLLKSGAVVFGATSDKNSTFELVVVNLGDEVVRFGDPDSYVGAFNYYFEFRGRTNNVEIKKRPSLITSMDPLTVHKINKGEFVKLKFDLGDGTWNQAGIEIEEFSEFRIIYVPPNAGTRTLSDRELYAEKTASLWVKLENK